VYETFRRPNASRTARTYYNILDIMQLNILVSICTKNGIKNRIRKNNYLRHYNIIIFSSSSMPSVWGAAATPCRDATTMSWGVFVPIYHPFGFQPRTSYRVVYTTILRVSRVCVILFIKYTHTHRYNIWIHDPVITQTRNDIQSQSAAHTYNSNNTRVPALYIMWQDV